MQGKPLAHAKDVYKKGLYLINPLWVNNILQFLTPSK